MAQTLGKQLAQKREMDGMSVEDVAYRTRIPANVVRHLENDDYSHFPNIVYARSFLRMYSAHLEVDAGAFLKELREAAESKPARLARSAPHYFRSQVSQAEVEEMTGVHWNFEWFPWRTILSAIFFATVLGAGGYVVYQLWDEHQNQPTAESPAAQPGTTEENLIGGKVGANEPAVPEDSASPSEGEGGAGADPLVHGGMGDEEVVLRAVPVEPQPGPALNAGETGGDVPPGDERPGEEGGNSMIEGPEVSKDPSRADADTVAASGPVNRPAVAPAPVVPPSSSTESTN